MFSSQKRNYNYVIWWRCYLMWWWWSFCNMYQINALDTLNLHNVTCQLYPRNTGKKKLCAVESSYSFVCPTLCTILKRFHDFKPMGTWEFCSWGVKLLVKAVYRKYEGRIWETGNLGLECWLYYCESFSVSIYSSWK